MDRFYKAIEEAIKYALKHPRSVDLITVDRKVTTYGAAKAIDLCRDRKIAPTLIGARSDDKVLEEMLNRIIDFYE